MVTEWGSPNGTQCAGYVKDMLNYVANNAEVCRNILRIALIHIMDANSMPVHWLGSLGSGSLLGNEQSVLFGRQRLG
jgi:hypothetical protein